MFFQSLQSNTWETAKRLTAGVVIWSLILAPVYPLQVQAEDIVEETPSVEEAPVVVEETVPEPVLEEEQAISNGEVIIDTGDAVAETDTESSVNVNVVEVETLPAENENVLINNEGVVENEATTTAATGENNASSTNETLITTGDAYASANVVSVVNLNLVESNGFLYLLNNFLQSLGHIDLRPITSSEAPPNSDNPCGTPTCDGLASTLKVETENDATISNVVIVRSSTGQNFALGGNGASINTGNAYAGANVVNVANTNIINSNYLLFAFNNFGGWNGDLIFPNSDFFSNFFTPFSTVGGANISNTNSANVENEVETSANTGDNETEGDGSLIETGNAVAGSNVANIINTNLVNAPTFFVVFRIFGNWNGSVFNAPEGISWTETPSGIELFSNDGANEDGAGGGGGIDVKTNNTANIGNNVKVFALTGENKATSAGGTASINTGNAYAGANVLNVANTNVISSNWIIALINIFGDWSGNVSFGQPDIWVASQVEGPEILGPGSEPIFHTTVANRGDASAHNVRFNGSFDSPHISFEGGDQNEIYSLEVGDLLPGEIKEFSYRAKVNGGLPYGDTLIDHAFEVSANETDGNPADNSDTVSLLARRLRSFGRSISYESVTKASTYPSLYITKTNSATGTDITASSTVDYTIVIENKGGSAFEGILYDVLKDENGKIITKNNWELGEIFPNEEITITYTAIFNASTTPGVYTNTAWVEALGGDYLQDPDLSTDASSGVASSRVTVESKGEVLGVSCGLYMDKFIRHGADNDVEQVMKLQEFLNGEMGAGLPVTGVYGPLTYNALKTFQEKYPREILAPWGLNTSTGIAYQTTLRWINMLECPALALQIPPLVPWSKNPNAPAIIVAIDKTPARNKIPPAKLDDNDIHTNLDNIDDTPINPPPPPREGLIDLLKNIFKQKRISQIVRPFGR
ncbi:MAG: peptidoglycan-binding protein [Candidatus Zambryskibacteria bacterium]|nr:peptidoglycan-binding protein [Candidatus Zambryskibacteria bacterium]